VSRMRYEVLDGGFLASYRWTPGPLVGRFLAALRDGPAILGARCHACQEVACPPEDVCGRCGGTNLELRPVGPQGVIVAHASIRDSAQGAPVDPPFAFVLVRLDGATTAMAHVAAGEVGCSLSVGDRVEARFAAERTGTVLDIQGFVPASSDVAPPAAILGEATVAVVPGSLDMTFRYSYGRWFSGFYAALLRGQIVAARCPSCRRVLLPPRPMCGSCFVDVEPDFVPVSDRGYVRTYTVVRMPYEGQPTEPPYCYALIVLDGADGELHHLVRELDPDDVFVGMRVRAVWRPEDRRTGSFHDIEYFVPEW
jgi:uncharacterized OB-fold protein